MAKHCWRCESPTEPRALFCGACRAILPPDPTLDHFGRLGLERRFAQDPDAVTKAHRALQRTLHPDRFVAYGDRARMLSLQHATALNDAVRVVRDPLRRADYLLTLAGRDVTAEEGSIKLDPMFLMEVIELREAIGELSGTDAHVERGRMERTIGARYEGMLNALGSGLDALDDRLSADAEPADEDADAATAQIPVDREAELDRLARQAAELRYLRRILDELTRLEG